MKKFIYTLSLVLLGTLAQAQVKIGANPGSITPGAVLDIEGSTSATRVVSLTNGNVGIGTTTPNAPLQLGNTFGARKLVLYEGANNDNQYLGFGVQAGMLRYQTGNSAVDDHVFLTGVSSTSSVELMRIKGNGNVGVGISAPTSKLVVEDNKENAPTLAIGNTGSSVNSIPLLRLYNSTSGNAYLFLNSSNRTDDGGPNTATLRNDAGTLRLQSSNQKGITINSGNATLDGALTIKNIPSSGGTVMLTADNDGIIRQQSLPTASAPTILGTLATTGGVSFTAVDTWIYTGSTITIPANSKYIVTASMLLASNTIIDAGRYMWVPTTLSDSPTNIQPTNDKIGNTYLFSGSIQQGKYGMLNGSILINNTSSAAKTYYYCVRIYGLGSNLAPGVGSGIGGAPGGSNVVPGLTMFGGNYWQENQLYALPIN